MQVSGKYTSPAAPMKGYGRNVKASLQNDNVAHAAGASILSLARGVFAGMRIVRAGWGGPGGLLLGSATHF